MLKIARIAIKKNAAFSDCIVVFGVKPYIVAKKEQEKADSYRLLTADNIYSDRYFDGDKAQALLLAAVATLPEVQRTVFTLRYFHEMKYSEISNILNTSEGALKASFHIASKKIHDFIESNDG